MLVLAAMGAVEGGIPVYADQPEQVAGPTCERLEPSDWLVPPPDHLLGRGVMGDGVIELRRLREAVDAAGYAGPIEVEIFNQRIWDMPGAEVLAGCFS